MCIIAVKPAHSEISTDNLFNMWMNNPHGAGFMYAKDGELRVTKGLMTFEELLAAYDTVRDEKLVMHFRWRTHGPTSKRLTHPFMVHKDVAMVHNGVIPRMKAGKKDSDTSVFAAKLRGLDNNIMNMIAQVNTRRHLMELIGLSKLVFMNAKGQIRIVNGKNGNFQEDVWYSNHSFMDHTTYDTTHGMLDYDPKNWKWSTKMIEL